MRNQNRQMREHVKIYDEPDSPSQGACLRYMMNQIRQVSGACLRYMMTPDSLNDGACLRYMMNRNRQVRGMSKIYDEAFRQSGGVL